MDKGSILIILALIAGVINDVLTKVEPFHGYLSK